MEASPNQSSRGGNSYDGKIAGLYDLEETLGSGHFAVVKLARHVFTGAKVAVKVVDKTKLDEVSKAHLFQEVRCMKLVQHPNVVRLYEVIDTQTKLYLVLELGDGGDLYDYIMKHEGGLSEDLARKYFKQILRAITYCHELHVVHRDLKPENVVFFEKLGIVKLTDFGFSNKFSPGQKLETFCGSLAYSAPEILLGDSYDAPAVDIWSLGVILYMLVCGQPPFEKANDSETLTMIMDCKYTVPSQITQTCRQLISSMLVRDPKKRATLEQIAAHPWLQGSTDFKTCDFLPLVSRQELSDEDHTFILQKMINGNIASKEEILHSLDKNIYNYITATYFLLAEIRLRKHREEQAEKQKQALQSDTSKSKSAEGLEKQSNLKASGDKKFDGLISINVVPAPTSSTDDKLDKRTRKCSIVREEDEEENVTDNTCGENELKLTITRRESISDGRLNKSIQERKGVQIPHSVPTQSRVKIVVPVDPTLAEKLNQIDKIKNVDHSKDNRVTEAVTIKGLRELEICKLKPLTSSSRNPVLTHRRSKLQKIRTPSCSSSEASDDDTKTRNKKKMNKLVGDSPIRFRMHRRDSHDDSSDSQDHPASGSHRNAQKLLSGNNNSMESKNEGQTQTKENKTEDNRKSSHSHTQRKKQHKDTPGKQTDAEKQYLSNLRRLRIRESQSLDRITEAQEYDARTRGVPNDLTIEHRNSLSNLSMFSVSEIKEEYDEEMHESSYSKNYLSATTATLHLKHNNTKIKNIYNIHAMQCDKSISKAIQITGAKCFVTIKKIRRLGKYFPVVNFS